MNNITKIAVYFVFLCLLFNCKSKSVKKIEKENKITFLEKDVVKNIYNQKKTLLLVLNYKSDKNRPTTFNYKVVEVSSKKTIKKGVFVGSKIEWLDNISLKCFIYQGIIQKEETNFNNYTIIKILNPK